MYRKILRHQFNMFCWLLLVLPATVFSLPQVSIKYDVFGIKDPAASNIVNRLKITQKQLQTQDPEHLVENLKQQLPAAVQTALQPYGYYQAKINAQYLPSGDKKLTVKVNVIPGPAVRIKQIHVTLQGPGADLEALKSYTHQLPMKPGDILDTTDYEKMKKQLFKIAYNYGYIKAQYQTSQVLVDRKKLTAVITLVFDTGPQYYFGAVRFNQSFFDPNFLQRYVRFKPGEPYSSKKLTALNKSLNNTTYFSEVSVHPQEGQTKNHHVPIMVNLTPSKAKKYTFGLGYGTDTGPRAQVGVNLRHLTPTGQHFESFLQASRIESTLNAHYYFPGKNPITDQSFIGATFETETPNTSKGQTAAINFGYQTLLKNWKTTASIGYQYDYYSLRGLPYRGTNLVLPKLRLSKSKMDDLLFPRKGSQYDIELRGTSRAISSTSFIQGIFGAKFVTSPTANSRLLMRTKLGITGVGNLERVPLSLQLFAGGAQSIRGYDYKELGPGKYLYVGSVEFQHKLYKALWGTAFVDAGNAVNNLRHPEKDLIGQPNKLANVHKTDIAKVGAGAGLMYVSPVGPLELTFANPITDRDKGWAVQFTMGTNL